MIEPSADVAPSAEVADSARVWHLAQVREDASIGEETIVGRGAYIGEGVRVGDRCKIQNYALVYEPASLADGVFVGPAAVFTNDHAPRAINADGTLKSARTGTASASPSSAAPPSARAPCAWPPCASARGPRSGRAPSLRATSPPTRSSSASPRAASGGSARPGCPSSPPTDAAPGHEAGAATWVCPATGRRYVERDGALSPEDTQASSSNAAEAPDHTREDQQ